MKYKEEIEKTLKVISEKKIMVLATSLNDNVYARNMSVVSIYDRVYFQTDREMNKIRQIENNNKVALCVDNIQITGEAEIIGTWEDNKKIKDKYVEKQAASYEKYKNIKKEIVIEVTMKEIEMWEYKDNKAYIVNIDLLRNEYFRKEYKLC